MEAITARFERTSTPSYKLLHAVNTGDTASVSTLLSAPDAQSFINTPNESGCTPLHLAVVKGNAAVTKQLLAARCNVDIQDDDGYTPLHNAASYRYGASVTEQLIDARCNMNLQDLKGCTPLCISALQGHESATKKLLLSRCNVDLQDKNGHTALQVAQRQGHAEIAKLIRRNKNKKGADRATKDALLQASPEKIKKQQQDADRAMKELLEEEQAAADSKKKQGKTDKDSRRKASKGNDRGVKRRCMTMSRRMRRGHMFLK